MDTASAPPLLRRPGRPPLLDDADRAILVELLREHPGIGANNLTKLFVPCLSGCPIRPAAGSCRPARSPRSGPCSVMRERVYHASEVGVDGTGAGGTVRGGLWLCPGSREIVAQPDRHARKI